MEPTESERRILDLAKRANGMLKAITEKYPDQIPLKMVEFNNELSRLQPCVILYIMEFGFYSEKALKVYLKSVRTEDLNNMAQARYQQIDEDERNKHSEADQRAILVRYGLEAKADSYVRYYSMVLREWHKYKNHRIDQTHFNRMVQRKRQQTIQELRQSKEEDEIAKADAERAEKANRTHRIREVQEWFQAAGQIPDYYEEREKTVTLTDGSFTAKNLEFSKLLRVE